MRPWDSANSHGSHFHARRSFMHAVHRSRHHAPCCSVVAETAAGTEVKSGNASKQVILMFTTGNDISIHGWT